MSDRPLNARVIPSIFTLLNLFFGFAALIWTIDRHFHFAAGMILLSVLMDSMDGKVARKLAVSSDFGKELDSLSDLVSFGVAPAILIYTVFLRSNLGLWGVLIAAVFALCGAIRLARFNVMNISTHFIGVPITFAGGFMALLMFFNEFLPWFLYPASLLILSFLMVSTFKVPKLGK
ncbi:CDP-alcohol phosphatidyltransferase [Peptococcaceae bacterium CEB3]|nr:CDP-alcohol phosphatidyltransferase [Peptococcaceae bacterium CEB3]